MSKIIKTLGRFAGAVFSALSNVYVGKIKQNAQREMFEEHKELEIKRMQLQAAIAQGNLQLQMELFQEHKKMQKELALSIAKAHKEAILENTREQIEHKFKVDNFPLYIRKSNYLDEQDDNMLKKVKIIFSPPYIGTNESNGNNYADSDIVMTSKMTQFLQENMPSETYEYLGSAWRDDRFRAQAAYRSIFNEFSDQPFLILDCDILRNSFNFRVCFWAPNSMTYNVQQIITDFKTDRLLLESARNRARTWREEVYKPMLAQGISRKKLQFDFSDEMANVLCLEREEELQKIVETVFLNRYHYDVQDYNYCIQMISQLNGIAVGMFLDFYQIASGNAMELTMLKKVPKILQQFPGTQNCPLKEEVENWIFEEYINFVEQLEMHLKELWKGNIGIYMPIEDIAYVMINCKIQIAEMYVQLDHKREAKDFLEEALQNWCQYMLGVKEDILFSKLKENGFYEKVYRMMQGDWLLANNLMRWYWISEKIEQKEEQKMIGKLLEEYRQRELS